MSRASVLPALFLTFVSAVALIATVLIVPGPSLAGEKPEKSSSCPAPPSPSAQSLPSAPGIRVLELPDYEPRDRLTGRDEIAALAAIQTGLSTTADGATFVWHRDNGLLSAIIRPTTTFRDTKGRVCRHVHLLLNSGAFSSTTEGVACRLANRTWSLEG